MVWIGRRASGLRTRSRNPHDVWPVRVSAGAFGHAAPERDLWLSPDHAVCIDGVLVPIRYLSSTGATIAQRPCRHVRYFHLELPAHAVVFAEGLTTESYLDTGNRAMFSDAIDIGAASADAVVDERGGAGAVGEQRRSAHSL